MRLSVRVPESDAPGLPTALSLIRAAPAYEVESRDGARTYVATFADLPVALDLSIRLIGEVQNLPDVQVTINSRPVASLSKFWSALLCYRDSLWEPDKEAYCARQADRVGEAAGCPVWTCQARCQFICARCLQVVRKSGAPPIADQLREIALQAEVEWCPNLKLP